VTDKQKWSLAKQQYRLARAIYGGKPWHLLTNHERDRWRRRVA
jgi:hypothetical protein